jgi:hypothetical protein
MNTAWTFSAALLAGGLLAFALVPVGARLPGNSALVEVINNGCAAKQQDPGRGNNSATPADVSGEWTVTGTKHEDPDPHELTMVLKQDRETFSGSLTTNKGRFDIKGGKVKATAISFSISMPQASMTATCSGTVDGDSLKATCQMPDSTIDLAGHRQKKAEKKDE